MEAQPRFPPMHSSPPVLVNSLYQPDSPQSDEHHTQRSTHEDNFPRCIARIEPGSATSPDTKVTLTDGFYYPMRSYLASSGAVGQTVTASRLTSAANNARPIPELQSAITDDFFRYLQNTCEADFGRWGQRNCETLSNGELDDYVYCILSSLLRGVVHGRFAFTFSRPPGGRNDPYVLHFEAREDRFTMVLQGREILNWENLGINLWHE